MKKTIGFTLLLFGILLADTVQEKVDKGNQLLQEKKFEEALSLYNEALIDAPESAIIKFNMGNVYYEQGRYDKAQERYEESLTLTQDSVLQSRIHYNMGNVHYRLGKWKESLESYQACMELCKEIRKESKTEALLPDEKARKNHALVQKKILEHVAKERQEEEKKKPDENHPVEKLKKLVQEQTQHYQHFGQEYRQLEAQLKQSQFLSLLQEELKKLQNLKDPADQTRWTLLQERFLKAKGIPEEFRKVIESLSFDSPESLYLSGQTILEGARTELLKRIEEQKNPLAETQGQLAQRSSELGPEFLQLAENPVNSVTPGHPGGGSPEESELYKKASELIGEAAVALEKAQTFMVQLELFQTLEQQIQGLNKLNEALLPFLNPVEKLAKLLQEQMTFTAKTQYVSRFQEQLLNMKKWGRTLLDWKQSAYPTQGSPETQPWEQLKQHLLRPESSIPSELREYIKAFTPQTPKEQYESLSASLEQSIQSETESFKTAQKELPSEQQELTQRSEDLSKEFLATAQAMEMMGQQAQNQQNPVQGITGGPSPKEQADLFLKAQKLISEASGELKQATQALEKPELPTALKNQNAGVKLLDEAYKLFQDKNQNQQKNEKEQDKNNQDKQDQEKQDQEKQDQNKDQEKQDQNKDQEKNAEEQKQEESPQELTEEETQRLLNQIRQQQQKRQDNNAKRATGTNEYVEKDW